MHNDFTGIQFTGVFSSLSIINVYNEITNNGSITALSTYLSAQ